MELGSQLESRGEWESAFALYRLGESQFPGNPEMLSESARLAERLGDLEGAWARWHVLLSSPAHSANAQRRIDFLQPLLPRRRFTLAAGMIAAADLDGDRNDELLQLSEDGVLSVYSVHEAGFECRGQLPLNVPVRFLHGRAILVAYDLDGDGCREICVAGGHPDIKQGALILLRWTGTHVEELSRADVHAAVHAIEPADVDGDGHLDLILALGHGGRAMHVYRCLNLQLSLSGTIPFGVDVQHVAFGDRSFTVCLGPWQTKLGYRAVHFTEDRGTFVKHGESDERFVASAAYRGDDGSIIFCCSTQPALAKVATNLLPPGIYRLWIDGTKPRIERLAEIAGESHLLASVLPFGKEILAASQATIFRFAGSVWEAKPARSIQSRVVAGDFDGDGSAEIAFLSEGGLEVWGLGDPSALPKLISPTQGGMGAGRPTPGESLMEAGLFSEAAEVFERELARRAEDGRLWFGLGQARAGMRRYAEAVEAFARAATDRRYETEAGFRRAYALLQMRDWVRLAEAVRWLGSAPTLDPLARTEVERLRGWVEEASAMAPRGEANPAAEASPLYCENPFDARVTPEGLALWQNSHRHTAAGLPLVYEGGPLRIRIRFTPFTPQWATQLHLGIGRSDPLGRVADLHYGRPGPYLLWTYGAGGATNQPYYSVTFQTVGRDFQATSVSLPLDQLILKEGRSHWLEIEYIPGLDQAFFSVGEIGGETLLAGRSLDVPFRLEKGQYLVGQWIPKSMGVEHTEYFACQVIGSVSIEAAHEGTRIARPAPSDAREWLLLANGDLAAGRTKLALAGYEEAIKRSRIEGDSATRWRAHLFRAWLHLQEGRLDRARADMSQALQTPGQEVEVLLQCASDNLSRDHRTRLLEMSRPDW